MVWASFWEGFLEVFWRTRCTDFELELQAGNLENSGFLMGICIFSRKPRKEAYTIYVKKPRKIVVFLDLRFGSRFERVWGGFWEVKILDFRTFFDVFSKQISKRVSKGEKTVKKTKK